MYFSSVLILSVILPTSFAFYENNKDVIELTAATFDSQVINSDDIWIVEFYAQWCGHCQALVPEYSKLASAVKGLVKVGALNADTHQEVGQRYSVRGFPTIKVFGADKKRPRDYGGARTAQGMVDDLLRELQSLVKARLSGGGRSGGSEGGSRQEGNPKDVVELTDSNFEQKVLKSEDMWLVEFFAPWCGHCKRLEPHWAEAATNLKGKVKLGALDATVHTIMASKYNVRGYPTIKFFPKGPKDSSPEDFEGGRTAQDIINWATEKAAEFAPPPEVLQVVSASILKEACEEHPLCVVSVLPHILDCDAGCRGEYLKALKGASARYRKNGWGWVWAEAMQQPHLEDALGMGGFGYPTMAVVNVRKMKYSILRGSFSYDGISEHIRDVSMGRGSSAPVKGAKLPDVIDIEPWDGKDGQLPVEEDIDLSDVDLDDTKSKTEL